MNESDFKNIKIGNTYYASNGESGLYKVRYEGLKEVRGELKPTFINENNPEYSYSCWEAKDIHNTKEEALLELHKRLMNIAKKDTLNLKWCKERLDKVEKELNIKNNDNVEYNEILDIMNKYCKDNTRWYQDEDYKEFSSAYLGDNKYLIRYKLSFNGCPMYMIVQVASITEKHRRAVDFARHFMKQSGLIK